MSQLATKKEEEKKLPQKQQPPTTAAANTQMSAALREMELQFEIALRYPRDEATAKSDLLEVCHSLPLCEKALYAFARGGNTIEGPSVHLVDEAVRLFGRIKSGWQIVNHNFVEDRFAEIRCVAVDMQRISIKERTIIVTFGDKQKDYDSCYYHAANYAERRTRTLCEKLLPDHILVDAVAQVKETLCKAQTKPLRDRIKEMLKGFQDRFGVSREQIEKRMQRKAEALTEVQMVNLKAIFASLKDGVGTVDQFFVVPTVDVVITEVTPDKKKGGKKEKVTPAKETQEATPKPDVQPVKDATVAPPGEEAEAPTEEENEEDESEEDTEVEEITDAEVDEENEDSNAWGFGE